MLTQMAGRGWLVGDVDGWECDDIRIRSSQTLDNQILGHRGPGITDG